MWTKLSIIWIGFFQSPFSNLSRERTFPTVPVSRHFYRPIFGRYYVSVFKQYVIIINDDVKTMWRSDNFISWETKSIAWHFANLFQTNISELTFWDIVKNVKSISWKWNNSTSMILALVGAKPFYLGMEKSTCREFGSRRTLRLPNLFPNLPKTRLITV